MSICVYSMYIKYIYTLILLLITQALFFSLALSPLVKLISSGPPTSTIMTFIRLSSMSKMSCHPTYQQIRISRT